MKKNKALSSRRELLSLGVAAGAGAIIGYSTGNLLQQMTSEKVKVISAKGEVYEVDRALFDACLRTPMPTNAALKEWLESEIERSK